MAENNNKAENIFESHNYSLTPNKSNINNFNNNFNDYSL